MIQDLRDALQSLRRRPVEAALAGAVLTLGLTGGLAVFAYMGAYRQPLPGADGEGLVRIFTQQEDTPYVDPSFLDYEDYAAASRAFEGIAAVQIGFAASVRLATMTEVALVEVVSQDAFRVLGVEVSHGRGIAASDDRPGAEPVAVLSYSWWQRSFGGDPSVIGQTVYLNYRPFTVVGVMSPAFVGTSAEFRPDVWVPVAPFRDRYTNWARRAEDRDIPLIATYGRLRDDVDPATARAELETIAARLDQEYPRPGNPRRIRIEPATWIDPRAQEAERPITRVMIAGAAGLLLLVCANVANLLLSFSAGRRREYALRATLGASPGRLARLVLLENLVISLLSGGAALLLAGPATVRLGSYFERAAVWAVSVPREAPIDAPVALFAIGVSVLTGLVAGLLPALRGTRPDLAETLKTTSTSVAGSAGRRGLGLQDLLVGAQVALSVVLLVVAALVLRTLATVSDRDPGFDTDTTVASFVSTSSTDLEPEEREQFFRELVAGLSSESWVDSVAVAGAAPLSGHPVAEFEVEGRADPVQLVVARVNPGFHEALGIEMVAGRAFETGDGADAAPVAIVNATMAERYFPDGSPVGRTLRMPSDEGAEPTPIEIVGVARDIKLNDFISPAEPAVFLSYPQQGYPSGSALVVRTRIDPGAAVPLMYRWLREFEPHLAIINVLPYRDVVSGFLFSQRMNAEMFSILGAVGILLAAVGLFSVLSLAIARRVPEIGVRMALGAQRGDIRRLVARRALTPVLVGAAVGALIAFAVRGMIRGLLEGVAPEDPVSLLGAALVLVLAAVLAVAVPARRATRVEPIIALRAVR